MLESYIFGLHIGHPQSLPRLHGVAYPSQCGDTGAGYREKGFLTKKNSVVGQIGSLYSEENMWCLPHKSKRLAHVPCFPTQLVGKQLVYKISTCNMFIWSLSCVHPTSIFMKRMHLNTRHLQYHTKTQRPVAAWA